MAQRRVNSRKTRIVLKEMQRRIVLQTAAFPLAALTLMAVAVTVLCSRLISEAAPTDASLPHLQRLLVAFLMLTPAMAGAILFVAFRFSHRIAGPTYRIVQSLKRIQEGDLGFRIQLRRNDFLTEIAEQFNETLDALQDGKTAERRAPGQEPDDPPAADEAANPEAEPTVATPESEAR